MAYYATAAQLWDALYKAGMTSEAHNFKVEIEGLMLNYAEQLAHKLEVKTGGCAIEQEAFGGLLVAFRPAFYRQPIPAALQSCDSPSEWGASFVQE